jgi:3-oxoacyl-[acyl-carrier-protein] synthase-3
MNHHSTAYGSIVGLVAAVPDRIITNADCPDPAAADEAAKLTGVRERRWVRDGQTAYDLNLAAANRVLAGMGWAGSELDLIVYVTQTPTRAVPADVYSLAAAVGATCPCMQLNWSCSGYVYGLWTAMRMLSAGTARAPRRGRCDEHDCRSHRPRDGPLFGDAGSATAIIGGGMSSTSSWAATAAARRSCAPTGIRR